jgi:hypothetical protein
MRALVMPPAMYGSLPLEFRAYNNHGLFADQYLNHPEHLQALDAWRQATGREEAFREIARQYNDRVNFDTHVV